MKFSYAHPLAILMENLHDAYNIFDFDRRKKVTAKEMKRNPERIRKAMCLLFIFVFLLQYEQIQSFPLIPALHQSQNLHLVSSSKGHRSPSVQLSSSSKQRFRAFQLKDPYSSTSRKIKAISINSIPSLSSVTSSHMKTQTQTASAQLLTALFMNDAGNNEYNTFDENLDDDDKEEDITDLSLSEFLKRQSEIMSVRSERTKGKRSGIRSRVSRWLKFNRDTKKGDVEDSNIINENPNENEQTDDFTGPSPPVQPLRLDGTPYENKENEQDENMDEFQALEDMSDLDVRTRAKKMREIQKEKRLQKAMEELKMQLENSPDDIVKNTPNMQENEINKSAGRKKVVRPNFDDLFQGVPGLDDLLGDSPLSAEGSRNELISGDGTTKSDNERRGDNVPRLDKDGNIVFESFDPSIQNEETLDNIDDNDEQLNDDNNIGSDDFYRMEQEMRKKAGLSSRPKRDESNDENDQNFRESQVKSREEINLEALASLEKLQKKKYGDAYKESGDIKSVRESSTSPALEDVLSLQEEEDSPEMRFKRMEEEMRKKTGLTSRPDKDKDDPNEVTNKSIREDITPKIAKDIRSKLSEDALLTLESLRRKKLGDNYVEMDQEEIIRKMKEIIRDENTDRDMLQNEDVFLGDDEIASWDEPKSDINQLYTEDPSNEEAKRINPNDDTDPTSQEQKGFNLFTKKATASDQIYRSIAAKSGGNVNDDKRSEWEAFLQREQEMREKMSMIESDNDYIDDQEINDDTNEPPNTDFFSSQKEVADDETPPVDDNLVQREKENSNQYFDRNEELESSLSSQIYRSIAAKEGSRDLGTEADFQAYFEKEAAMREKMGMSISDEESAEDGRLDMTNIFADVFESGDIKNRDNEGDNSSIRNPPYNDYGTNENVDNDADASTEAWLRSTESSLNIDAEDPIEEFLYESVDDGSPDDDSPDNGIDDWIRRRENVHEQSSPNVQDNVSNDSVPSTPFFQNQATDDYENSNDEIYDEVEQIDYINSDPSFPSSKYAYDPSDFSDMFGRDATEEEDYHPDKVALDSFSSYNARKSDLLERTELAVEDLNALGEFDPMAKLSMKLKPDSAFGGIFRLEGTLVDTTEMQMKAWTRVADLHGFEPPSREEVQRAQLIMGDEAVRTIFFWTFDIMESRNIALSHYDALQDIFREIIKKHEEIEYRKSLGENLDDLSPMFQVNEGAIEWLDRLREVGMPCAVMSQLDREKLDDVLRVSLLDDFFTEERRVSSNCGYSQESQEMLGAALRIQRRPDHCVVFDTSPSSSIAAHDAEMKSVGLLGLFALYELNTADMTIPSFDDLSVINIRRLFSDENFDEPEFELEKQKPERDRDPRIRTWAEGDRF